MHVQLRRACVMLTTTAVVGLVAAGTASAHVTANAPGAVQGGFSVISFRVPNESETATTTGLTIALPADAALKSVRAETVTGWSSTVRRSADGTPTAVVWTAQPGTSIGADQFGQFDLNVGPLPKTDSISFDATQTYSDGSVVRWDEPAKPDGSEPDHPAPEISLAAGGPITDDDGMVMPGDSSGPSVSPAAAAGGEAASTSGTDTTARWLGIGGLLVGALGLGVGAGATIRARRS